ncbi:MAG: hypothetical protein MUC63_06080, partial [Planctomycetes bacterium]|nr:hypothetical protein [Planctomycetota bacterium]
MGTEPARDADSTPTVGPPASPTEAVDKTRPAAARGPGQAGEARPRKSLGPYEILGEIGRGGM